MKQYVLGASLLIRALLNPDSSASRELTIVIHQTKNTVALTHAPTFLWTEMANGLLYGAPSIERAIITYTKFTEIPITPYHLTPDQSRAIIRLAYQTKTTVYDTSYHYLAIELDGTFLTCDKDYFRKAGSLGHIKLLAS